MGDVVHTSRIRIVREKGPTRKAVIEGFSEPFTTAFTAASKGSTASSLKRSIPPPWIT